MVIITLSKSIDIPAILFFLELNSYINNAVPRIDVHCKVCN